MIDSKSEAVKISKLGGSKSQSRYSNPKSQFPPPPPGSTCTIPIPPYLWIGIGMSNVVNYWLHTNCEMGMGGWVAGGGGAESIMARFWGSEVKVTQHAA